MTASLRSDYCIHYGVLVSEITYEFQICLFFIGPQYNINVGGLHTDIPPLCFLLSMLKGKLIRLLKSPQLLATFPWEQKYKQLPVIEHQAPL